MGAVLFFRQSDTMQRLGMQLALSSLLLEVVGTFVPGMLLSQNPGHYSERTARVKIIQHSPAVFAGSYPCLVPPCNLYPNSFSARQHQWQSQSSGVGVQMESTEAHAGPGSCTSSQQTVRPNVFIPQQHVQSVWTSTWARMKAQSYTEATARSFSPHLFAPRRYHTQAKYARLSPRMGLKMDTNREAGAHASDELNLDSEDPVLQTEDEDRRDIELWTSGALEGFARFEEYYRVQLWGGAEEEGRDEDMRAFFDAMRTTSPVTVRINTDLQLAGELMRVAQASNGLESLKFSSSWRAHDKGVDHGSKIPGECPGWRATGKLVDSVREFLVEQQNRGGLARQELVSMLPAHFLLGHDSADRGHDVLDMCASPGSKSTQLLNMMGDGMLVANEFDRRSALPSVLRAHAEVPRSDGACSCLFRRGLITEKNPLLFFVSIASCRGVRGHTLLCETCKSACIAALFSEYYFSIRYRRTASLSILIAYAETPRNTCFHVRVMQVCLPSISEWSVISCWSY